MANKNSLKNLKPGFRSSGGSFRVEVNGLYQAAQVIAAMPAEARKNASAAAIRNMGTLSREAERIFKSSILRPREHGQERFRGGRQTGNFTFGVKGGGAFQGRVVDEGDLTGFGWPDIATADAHTNEIWRALEFGLKGTSKRPSVLAGFGNLSYLKLRGTHRLPKGYSFTTKTPSTAVMYPWKQRQPQVGSGIEGKHFIERAWVATEATVGQRYKKAVIDAVGLIKK
jgi:hypothetical protein